jgi:protein-S-isoprenylcysteine O-methyltransferase Ste14
VIMAATVEEKENMLFFGTQYSDYMKRTKMSILFLI